MGIFFDKFLLYVNHFGNVFSDEIFSIVKIKVMDSDFCCQTVFLYKIQVNFYNFRVNLIVLFL